MRTDIILSWEDCAWAGASMNPREGRLDDLL